MTTRRSRGEGGLHWDESRQRWIATAALGFDARGKRITRKASGTTKSAAKQKLKAILRDHEDGLTIAENNYRVTDAVRDWLGFGLAGRSAATIANYTTIAERHVIAQIGARRLRDLSAQDVDRWLLTEAPGRQHAHAAAHVFPAQSGRHACDGPRQGQAQRRDAL